MLNAEPGALIAGRYRLVKMLGAGGAGRVWLAHDLKLGDISVAMKEIPLPLSPGGAEYDRHLERAQREARNAQKLRDHPNIVTVYDFLIEHEVPWIVMQFINGRSLHDALANGPLPVATVKQIAAALLDALEAAHGKQIVHRDIKPANIMLADDGAVLLTDFGIAHFQSDSGLTTSGMVIGSAEYLAPERARGEKDSAEGDLFSLGVTLYHTVEGNSPFRRASALASLHAVLSDEAPPLRHAGWLEPLITRLMAKNPADRPIIATARALLNEPTTVTLPPPSPTIVSPGSGPKGPTPPPKPPRPTPRPNPWASLLLGLAVVAGIVAWLYHGNQGFSAFVTDRIGLSSDAASAHQGDCLHQDPLHGWVKVPCFSAAADRKVLQQLSASAELGNPCTTLPGWDNSTDSILPVGATGHKVQLCTAPRGQTTTAQGTTPTETPTTYASPTYTPPTYTPPTYTPPTYTPPTYIPPTYDQPSPDPTTPSFDPQSLDNAQADQTPLTSNALLPNSFTDSKGVVYTLDSGSSQSCLTSHEGQDVQTVLRNGSCVNQIVGTYTDSLAHIMVAVEVEPMTDTQTAIASHNSLASAYGSDWGIWCPKAGPGSQICDNGEDTSHATQTSYVTNHHRYLVHALALYISLGTDKSDEPWTNAAAFAAVNAAGPQNYSSNQ
ncbi:serine/threonine-protein kinase [Kitasatospora kifunensis]|uniref:non-specific serine/threonine protein kinase n=1 Tax=Kitasatospora kifunensis TaxID=58351 RepID=A0A7W7R8A7_KITKI|nr:serine/threonine-protein kinase [Kitasatospora kifunensis]MBB4927302.1 serine/threonine protein kinase [Kitasatospora kifunensis]